MTADKVSDWLIANFRMVKRDENCCADTSAD